MLVKVFDEFKYLKKILIEVSELLQSVVSFVVFVHKYWIRKCHQIDIRMQIRVACLCYIITHTDYQLLHSIHTQTSALKFPNSKK